MLKFTPTPFYSKFLPHFLGISSFKLESYNLHWLYRCLSSASSMMLCIEYITDRIFNSASEVTTIWRYTNVYIIIIIISLIYCDCVTLKSDKTSFIGTHCDTICWETVDVQFFWPTRYIPPMSNAVQLPICIAGVLVSWVNKGSH